MLGEMLDQDRGLLDERRVRLDTAEGRERRVQRRLGERNARQPRDSRTVGAEQANGPVDGKERSYRSYARPRGSTRVTSTVRSSATRRNRTRQSPALRRHSSLLVSRRASPCGGSPTSFSSASRDPFADTSVEATQVAHRPVGQSQCATRPSTELSPRLVERNRVSVLEFLAGGVGRGVFLGRAGLVVERCASRKASRSSPERRRFSMSSSTSAASESLSGETRTRTGDTTIFSRVELALSLANLQGFSSLSSGMAVSALSRTLRSFAV
jgi:hypothetical protein